MQNISETGRTERDEALGIGIAAFELRVHWPTSCFSKGCKTVQLSLLGLSFLSYFHPLIKYVEFGFYLHRRVIVKAYIHRFCN